MIVLPAPLHYSRWKTRLAEPQGRAHDLSRAAARQSPVGALPFPESLCLRSLLIKDGRMCVKQATVINKIYADLAGASLGAAVVLVRQISWSDWGAFLESVSLPTAEVNLFIWARTGDFQRVQPQGVHCQFCKLEVLSWKPHLLRCAVLLASAAFGLMAVLRDLYLQGWSIVSQSVWQVSVRKEDVTMKVVMYRDGTFEAEPSTNPAPLSGLVSCVRRSGDRSPPLSTAMFSRLLVAYSEGFARMAHEQDKIDRLCQTQLPLCGGPPWATGVLCSMIAAHSGVKR